MQSARLALEADESGVILLQGDAQPGGEIIIIDDGEPVYRLDALRLEGDEAP